MVTGDSPQGTQGSTTPEKDAMPNDLFNYDTEIQAFNPFQIYLGKIFGKDISLL